MVVTMQKEFFPLVQYTLQTMPRQSMIDADATLNDMSLFNFTLLVT